MRLFGWMALLLFGSATASLLQATTHTGTVISVEGDVAKIAMDGDVMPRIGTRAEIFFKMAGSDAEVLVATGSALKIDDGNLLVKIEEATGTVDKGQLVRFAPATSTSPSAPTTPAASPTAAPPIISPPDPQRSIVGKWTGQRAADGLSASYHFKADGTVAWDLKRGSARQRDKGKYRVNYDEIPHRIDIIDPPQSKWDGLGLHGIFEFLGQDTMKMEFGLTRKASDRPTQFTAVAVVLSRSTGSGQTRQGPDDVPNTFTEAQSTIEAHPPPPQASPTVTGLRFAGQWKVQKENASYTLTLRQDGSQVTGSYDLYNGTLKGSVQSGTLVATWNQPGNRRGGSARLRLSADGQTLTGSWTYNPALYSSGLKGTGTWTFRRVGP